MRLALWSRRFLAWFLDYIFVGGLTELAMLLLGIRDIELTGLAPYSPLATGLFFTSPIRSVVFFAYWTFLEGYSGRSLGKMALRLKILKEDGQPIGFLDAALGSLGKAFFLPIDCIIGWIAFKEKKQRLFNRIASTVVIQLKEGESGSSPPPLGDAKSRPQGPK